jgi:hypothetical protein
VLDELFKHQIGICKQFRVRLAAIHALALNKMLVVVALAIELLALGALVCVHVWRFLAAPKSASHVRSCRGKAHETYKMYTTKKTREIVDALNCSATSKIVRPE